MVPASVTVTSPSRRLRLRWPLAAVGTLIVLGVGIGVIEAASAAPAVASTPAAPLRVAVVGDSLIEKTLPEQRAELAGRGYDATVEGEAGKPLADAWTQARLDEATGADIVVIATASNDNVGVAQRAEQVGLDQALGEYGTHVADAIAHVGARCTVLVDARQRTMALYHPETTDRTDQELRDVARTSGAVVVPWSWLSAWHDQRDWFVGDELHFVSTSQRQEAGVRAYVGAVADGVDRCAARLAAG